MNTLSIIRRTIFFIRLFTKNLHSEREVYSAWCRRLGPVGTITRLPAEQVEAVFNDMQLYPTRTQVCDMLQCAKDNSSDRSSPSYLTFGEFCTFATELKRCYELGISYSSSMTKLLDRDAKEKKKRSHSKRSKMMSKHQVFLGGSCNPTTWRQDVAIPLLNKLGITYYNPQVDQWNPELVEHEFHAKENASVLFYVINNETRNVSGIIEAAYLAGRRRKLILVVDSYRCGQTLCGEIISQQEYEELDTSLEILKDLVERQGIPVFTDIPLAIDCTAKVLKDEVNVKEIASVNNISDITVSIKFNNYQNGDMLLKIKEVFNSLHKTKDGQINLSDMYMACRILMNRKITVNELKKVVASLAGKIEGVKKEITFEDFCLLVSSLSGSVSPAPTPTGITNGTVKTTTQSVGLGVPAANIYDVYVGGCCFSCNWTEEIVIPLLRKNNLSYYLGSHSDRLDLSSDMTAVNNSYMMLFCIPSTVRGLATMAMASYYIGLGCNVVLFVQHLPENNASSLSGNDSKAQVRSGDELSEQSINDYNRGRMYLMDLAQRDDIPVLQNIQEAVECVVQKCTLAPSSDR